MALMNHGKKRPGSQRPCRLLGPFPQHARKGQAVSDQGFRGLMQPPGCITLTWVQELRSRAAGAGQAPSSSVLSCGASAAAASASQDRH